MTRQGIRLCTLVSALVVGSLLGGCITPGPATRFYLLTPAAEAVPAQTLRQASAPDRAAQPLTVVITDIRLPMYLDRPQIVTRDSNNRLEFSEIDQWGGHLREDLGRVLAINLGRVLAGDRVVAAPHAATVPPDYRVEVDILAFERQPGGRVTLSAQWSITRGSDGKLHAGSAGIFSGEALGDSAAYDKLVGSMSAVYGELARAIARGIRPHTAAGS